MNKSDDITEIAKALNKAQGEITSAKKNAKNPFFKSSYSDLSEIIECSKRPLQNNGLSVCQFPVYENPCSEYRVQTCIKDNRNQKETNTDSYVGYVGVETIVMHNSGQWLSQKTLLAVTKHDPQSYGSAISYAKRYARQAILGIPSEDDDGNKASGNQYNQTPTYTPTQKPKPAPTPAPKANVQRVPCPVCNVSQVEPGVLKCYKCKEAKQKQYTPSELGINEPLGPPPNSPHAKK